LLIECEGIPIAVHNVYIYKSSGELIYHRDYHSVSAEVDPIIVSGFFSAIQSFGKTITADEESLIKEIDTEKFLITFSRDPATDVTVALLIDPEDRNWASTVIPELLDLISEKLSAVPESQFTVIPLEYFKSFDDDVDAIVKPAEKTIEQKKKVIPILLKGIDKLKVSVEESRILNLIDGERSVAEIADLLKILYFKVMMTCLDLKKRGIIDTKEVF
jgi:hypothetical protein